MLWVVTRTPSSLLGAAPLLGVPPPLVLSLVPGLRLAGADGVPGQVGPVLTVRVPTCCQPSLGDPLIYRLMYYPDMIKHKTEVT